MRPSAMGRGGSPMGAPQRQHGKRRSVNWWRHAQGFSPAQEGEGRSEALLRAEMRRNGRTAEARAAARLGLWSGAASKRRGRVARVFCGGQLWCLRARMSLVVVSAASHGRSETGPVLLRGTVSTFFFSITHTGSPQRLICTNYGRNAVNPENPTIC